MIGTIDWYYLIGGEAAEGVRLAVRVELHPGVRKHEDSGRPGASVAPRPACLRVPSEPHPQQGYRSPGVLMT